DAVGQPFEAVEGEPVPPPDLEGERARGERVVRGDGAQVGVVDRQAEEQEPDGAPARRGGAQGERGGRRGGGGGGRGAGGGVAVRGGCDGRGGVAGGRG